MIYYDYILLNFIKIKIITVENFDIEELIKQ